MRELSGNDIRSENRLLTGGKSPAHDTKKWLTPLAGSTISDQFLRHHQRIPVHPKGYRRFRKASGGKELRVYGMRQSGVG
jgi:hypothetical protein